MLFKALLYRLTGGSNQSSLTRQQRRGFSKLTYDKYPRLVEIVEKLLEESCFWHQSDSLVDQTSRQVHNSFPALEIINRVGVAESRLREVKALLLHQLKSPTWTLRDKVARNFCHLTDNEDMMSGIVELMECSNINQNELHGKLLCLKHFYSIYAANQGDSDNRLLENVMLMAGIENARNSIDMLASLFEPLALKNSCPFTTAAYLQSLAFLLRIVLGGETFAHSRNAETENDQTQARSAEQTRPIQACLYDIQQGFLDKKFPVSQLYQHLRSNRDSVKKSSARVFAFVQTSISTSSTVMPTTDRISSVQELLGPELTLAQLEALEAIDQQLSIESILSAMRNYLDIAQSKTVDLEQALEYLAPLLGRAQLQSSLLASSESDLKHELSEVGLKILNDTSLLLPKSPSVAQSALRAKGGIFTVLLYCRASKAKLSFGRHFQAWAHSLRLNLDENLVLFLIVQLVLQLTEDDRNILTDMRQYKLSTLSVAVWLTCEMTTRCTYTSSQSTVRFMML